MARWKADINAFNSTPQAAAAGMRFDFALAATVPQSYEVDTPAVPGQGFPWVIFPVTGLNNLKIMTWSCTVLYE